MYRPDEVLRPNVTVGCKGVFCDSDKSEDADNDDLLICNDFGFISEVKD